MAHVIDYDHDTKEIAVAAYRDVVLIEQRPKGSRSRIMFEITASEARLLAQALEAIADCADDWREQQAADFEQQRSYFGVGSDHQC